MDTCDVLIVGGGPAGSTLAWTLRDAGLDVLVMDKKTFPRDKVCAGWVTPAVVDALQLDIDDYKKSHTFQPIYGFRVSHMGHKEVEARYQEPASYSIRRCEFDDYLLKRAAPRLMQDTPFKDARAEDDGWFVNDQIKTRLLVGAGGHFCPVARALGADLGRAELVVAAQEIEFEMNAQQQRQCRVEPEVPELFFCEDLNGYGWVVRKQNYLNIGLGRKDNHKLSEHVAAFREFLIKRGTIPADTPARFHGHAYLLYPYASRPLVGEHALLIGDAAGLAYPQSGEGIRPAIESALYAGDVIRRAGGNYDESRLRAYADYITARFGDRSQSSISGRLPSALTQFVAGQLLARRWFVKHFVVERWFLHKEMPPLQFHAA
jgi:geranylgeranyl reductase family protein